MTHGTPPKPVIRFDKAPEPSFRRLSGIRRPEDDRLDALNLLLEELSSGYGASVVIDEVADTQIDLYVTPRKLTRPVDAHVYLAGGGHTWPYRELRWSRTVVRQLATVDSPEEAVTALAEVVSDALPDNLYEAEYIEDTQYGDDFLEESVDYLFPLVSARDGTPVTCLYSPAEEPTMEQEIDWAGLREHPGGPPPIGLFVPSDANHRRVFAEFLRFLNWYNLDSVPTAPPRLSIEAGWLSPLQTDLTNQREAVRDEIDTLEQSAEQLDQEIGRIQEEGEDGTRLLHDAGNSLAAAVLSTLTDLEFEVEDLDAQRDDDNDPRKGDLLVTDPSDDWTAIVEVKGYQKGARVNDLRDVRRHQVEWSKETNRQPDGVWWVFNDHTRIGAVGERPEPLQGSRERLESDNIVGIPTRSLFQLWRAVRLHTMDAAAARQLLKSLDGELLDPDDMVTDLHDPNRRHP